MISVSIVEDDKELRESLIAIICEAEGLSCIAAYHDCESALRNFENNPSDMVLMDIELPGMSGIEGVRRMKEKFSDVEIIMLTIHEGEELVFESLCAGACGYLKKNIQPEKLVDAIKEAHSGGAPMSTHIARMVVESFQRKTFTYALTNREKEVLSKICEGKSYKVIGNELFITEQTVKFHIRNIYRILEVKSKGEAIAKAFKERLV